MKIKYKQKEIQIGRHEERRIEGSKNTLYFIRNTAAHAEVSWISLVFQNFHMLFPLPVHSFYSSSRESLTPEAQILTPVDNIPIFPQLLVSQFSA